MIGGSFLVVELVFKGAYIGGGEEDRGLSETLEICSSESDARMMGNIVFWVGIGEDGRSSRL